jgi:hypothetical protein
MTIIDELREGGGAKDIQIVGDLAYVLSDSGLNIYNTSNPFNTFELGHYYSDGYLGHSIGYYNNFVFAAADDRGLKIINVTNPSNPELADTYTTTRPAALFIYGNLLFVANWDNDFEIYNITNVPSIIEMKRFEGSGFSYAYAYGDYAFGFANNGSLLILAINNPEHIEKLKRIEEEELFSIAVKGNYWYTGGPAGIKVFNATEASDPTLITHITETESTFVTNLFILDGYLYASDFHQGFRIFEIKNSINLTEIGRDDVGGAPLGFQVIGEIIYVASQIRGIEIVEIQFIEVEPGSSTIPDSTTTDDTSTTTIESTSTTDETTSITFEFLILATILLGFLFKRKKTQL